jgi:hypothetical protein
MREILWRRSGPGVPQPCSANHELLLNQGEAPLTSATNGSKALRMRYSVITGGVLGLFLSASCGGPVTGPGAGGTHGAGAGGSATGGRAGSAGAPAPDGGASDVCQLPKVGGPCLAYFPRWWFNRATGKCESFIYGGCQGNANSFARAEECLATCGAQTSNPCELVTCERRDRCVFVRGQATCAPPCSGEGTCTEAEVCSCGSTCPVCRDCVSVCLPLSG